MTGPGGQVPPPDSSAPIHLAYRSPVVGPITLWGWWRLPSGVNVSWDRIGACADANTSDDLLACDLPVPSGAPVFEFQVELPDGRYWGDHACDSGGCDKPLGTLTLTHAGEDVPYEFVPNGSGPPYYNGRLMPVP